MEQVNILVVDDEKEIRELVEIYLTNEGYKVFTVENGIEALKIVKKEDIKLVILDVMLPDIDGINICKSIREAKDMPIIMLSAKREDKDKILGILTGADDYVAKPFNPLELMVRVKAQLRRYIKEDISKESNGVTVGNLSVNFNKFKVMVNDKEVKLTPKEFGILKLLINNRGRVFSSKAIYEEVWNEEFLNGDGTIMTHIKNLREKLGDDRRSPIYIKTVWGVGYKID
ncbi:MAG: response regulator transcription factor [Clostridiaceae bacterium]|nr:response regulator transcription factor [Clostridiaceae bacterium]